MPLEEAPVVYSFTIDSELADSQLLSFPRFIREKLAFGQIPGIRMSEMEAIVGGGGHYLQFIAGSQRAPYEALVRVYLGRPLKIEVRSSAGRDEAFEKQLANALLIAVQFFEEEARQSMIYVAFVPGSPRTSKLSRRSNVLRKLLSGSMLSFFLLVILIGVPLFILFDMLAPIMLVGIMLTFVLSSGRLMAWRSPWRITKQNRDVLLVQQTVPQGELAKYRTEYRDLVRVAKQNAYETFSDCPGLACAEKVSEIFGAAGLPADPKSFLVRRVDLRSIVERASSKFGMAIPRIVVTQDPKPNAAATGVTKNLATVLVTLGLLVQLSEEEVEVVVGHEMSHLRSGDPIALFSLVVTEYLLRVYVFWQYIAFLWLPYLVAVFWGIFFFGKFLESRADLEAGVVLGKPKVMAEALKKIGFRRLVLEERFLEPGVSRFGEWMRFDPHPPLYFRIQRLESLDITNPPKHPFLSSVRAVASGFLHSRGAP